MAAGGTTFDAGTVHAELKLERKDFIEKLKKSKQEMREFVSKTYAPSIGLKTTKFRTELRKAEADLRRFARQSASATLSLDSSKAKAKIKELADELGRFASKSGAIRLRVELESYKAKINAAIRDADVLDRKLKNLKLVLDRKGFTENIRAAKAQVDSLKAKARSPRLGLDKSMYDRKMGTAIGQMQSFTGKEHKAKLGLSDSQFYRDLAVARTQIRQMVEERRVADILVRLNDRQRVRAALQAIKHSALNATSGIKSLSRGMRVATAVSLIAAPSLGLVASAIAALPGAVALAAGPIAAIALGIDGIKKASEVLRPALNNLKITLASTFQAGLTPIFREWAHVLFPLLTVGLNRIAKSLVFVAQQVSSFITSAPAMRSMRVIFGNIAKAVRATAPLMRNMTAAFLTLTRVGTTEFLNFTTILNQWAADFRKTIDNLASTGQLQAALRNMGKVIGVLLWLFNRLFQAGIQFMASAGPDIVRFFRILAQSLVGLMPFLKAISLLFFELAIAILPPLVRMLTFLAQPIIAVANWLRNLNPAVTNVIGNFLALVIVGKLLMGAFRLLILPFIQIIARMFMMVRAAVLLTASLIRLGVAWIIGMGPVAWIIAGIIALVALFVWMWHRFDWFRNFWIGLWNNIASFFVMVWRDWLRPAIQAFVNFWVGAWNWVRDAAVNVWNFMRPIFESIWYWIRFIGAIIITVLAAPFIIAWQLISSIFMWAWNERLRPGFQGIARAARWLWNNALKPAFNGIGWLFNKVLTGMRWAWENILRPAWDAVAGAMRWLWNNVLRPLFGATRKNWDALTRAVRWAWRNILKPAWEAVAGAGRWLWRNVLKPVFEGIKWAWDWVAWGLRYAWRNRIKPTWDAVAGAGRWLWRNVLRPVFRGIRTGWRAIGDAMRWVKRNIIDKVFNGVKAGMRKVGDVMNSVGDWIRRKWSQIRTWIAKPAKWVIDVVWNAGIRKFWNQIADVFGLGKLGKVDTSGWGRFNKGGEVPGRGPDRDTVPAMLTTGEYVLNRNQVDQLGGMGEVKKMFEPGRRNNKYDDKKGAAGTERPGGHSAAPQGAQGWRSLVSLVNGMFPNARITSTKRNTNDYHGTGNAVDFVTPNMAASARKLVDQWGSRSTEIINNPGASVKNGRNVPPSFWGPGTWNAHRDHIHWAVAGRHAGDARSGRGGGGGLLKWISPLIAPALKGLQNIAGGITGKLRSILGDRSDSPWGKAITGIPKKAIQSVIDFINGNGKTESSTASAKPAGQWRGTVEKALKMLGMPLGWTNATLKQIGIESGGDPNAVNNWDSNAAKGTPSKGLLQTIGPTFNAHKFPGHNNILNPLDNILAGLRYTVNRYGSVPNIWPTRGGYDQGGWLPPGMNMAFNGTGMKEAVLTNRQWRDIRSLVDYTAKTDPQAIIENADGFRQLQSQNGGGNGDVFNVYAETDANPKEILTEAMHAKRVASKGVRYRK